MLSVPFVGCVKRTKAPKDGVLHTPHIETVPSRASRFQSSEYFLNHVTVNVGQPEVASGMAVREPLVIEA